jgi:signal transduction histidine kinase/CheY-like chemotaxis protein
MAFVIGRQLSRGLLTELKLFTAESNEDKTKKSIDPEQFRIRELRIIAHRTNVLLEENMQAQIKLDKAKRMESIGLMAGGVAHDLNNILSGIVGYPELLLQLLPHDSKLRKPIEAIRESGQRAATVVADLLTVARGAASIREPHDVNSLIQEYLNSPECVKLKSLYPDVTCINQCTAVRSIVSCSPVHVKKCIMNLAINAAEAIKEAGTIAISTENHVVDTITGTRLDISPGDYVVINVKDTGSGISNDELKHIFEPFYSKKVMGRSGTGLGLTVVWNTMEDHGGKVIVDSDAKGTCFQLYFPTVQEVEVKYNINNYKEDITGNGEHILVVDDEPHLRDISSQVLQSLGYRVDVASSGKEAIEFAKETKFNLIVLDMLMEPGINGRQTYEEILKINPAQRAIVASGFSESDDVKATLKLGAGGFIKKPCSIEQLGRAVKKVLMAS